jgi:maltose O-acetyltransferase
VGRRLRIEGKGGIRIGEGTNVNARVHLDGRGGLTIGSRVNISPEALLLSAGHDLDAPDFAGREAMTTIADRVWIASRAIILPGAQLGEGVVVAAGAVVRGTVPPWTVVAGNPARPVAERSREAQEVLPPYRRWLG